jgi:hypothetical protein
VNLTESLPAGSTFEQWTTLSAVMTTSAAAVAAANNTASPSLDIDRIAVTLPPPELDQAMPEL